MTFISGTGADITLAGALHSSSAGTAFSLSSGRNFINGADASAFDLTGGGRWLVYSHDAASDAWDGLSSDFHRYSCSYGGSCPGFPGTGNGALYSYRSLLAVNPLGQTITDGALPTFAYQLTGYLRGDSALDAISGSPAFITTYRPGIGGGLFDITAQGGTLASSLGYGFSGATLSGGLLVALFPRPPPAAALARDLARLHLVIMSPAQKTRQAHSFRWIPGCWMNLAPLLSLGGTLSSRKSCGVDAQAQGWVLTRKRLSSVRLCRLMCIQALRHLRATKIAWRSRPLFVTRLCRKWTCPLLEKCYRSECLMTRSHSPFRRVVDYELGAP